MVDDGIFKAGDSITRDAPSVAGVAGQLQRYSLSRTNRDVVVGDAFEAFAEAKPVGEKGQFFPPGSGAPGR